MVDIVATTWRVVLAPGIVDNSDLANIQTPAAITGITDVGPSPGSRVFAVYGGGTHIAVQLAYPSDLVVSVDPIVVLFGRHGVGRPWKAVTTVSNKQQVTLKTNLDIDEIGFKRTVFDVTKQAWNRFGYNQFAFGVHTALVGTVGNASLAFVEAKVFQRSTE